MSENTFDLPVKRYINKYLCKQLNDQPLSTSWKSSFGVFMHNILRKQIVRKDYNKFLGKYSSTYPLHVGDYHTWHHSSRNFTGWTIIQANNLLENEFKRELYYSVTLDNNVKGMQVKEAVYSFTARYNITEDDASYDMLIKQYYRVKEEKIDRSILFWEMS